MAGGESSSTAESQAVDGPQTGKYTWVVKNFSKIRAKNIYSDSFVVGAWKWRVLLYPKGDGVDQLSAYVDVADKATLPYGWSRSASFNLSVINQSDRKGTVKRGAKHEFSARQNDWGFKSFMPLEELNDTSRGFLMNDTLIVEADVNIPRIVNYSAFDSKKVCVQKDQEEVERNRREKEEAERNKKEKEEEERRRKEEEEAERRRKDEEEPERRRKKEEEAEHKRKEKEEEERNKKEKEQEERRRKEEEQAERRRKEQEEAERKGKEKDEEERKRRQKEEQERKGKQIEEERKREEKEEEEQKRKDKRKEERKRKEGNRKDEEEVQRERKVKAEARLYTIIKLLTSTECGHLPDLKVARDSDLKMQIGKHIHFDLVDHDNVKSFRMEKQTFFTEFKEEIENELGIPVICQRFWLWAKRHNHTCRPYRPLNEHEERQTVGSLKETSSQAHHAELKLFLEVSIPFLEQTIPAVPLEKTEEDVLLFFKLYNPEKEELRYVGRTFVKSYEKPMYILDTLKEMAGFAPSDAIDLYEEIQFTPNVMCEHIDKNSTFRASKKARSNKKNIIYRYSDVPSFLEYVRNRQAVQFWRLEKPEEDGFCLELSKQHTYDEVVGKVAEQLGLADASKIRLTSYDCYTQRPKAQSIKYRGVDYLSDMLVHCNQSVQTWGILYFETLDLPLPELQRLKTLKVSFHNMKTERLSEHEIRLPKQSTMGDVIKELKGKVGLSSPTGELRIIEVFLHKIYRIFPSSEKIESINEQHWILRAEEIPEEEKHLGWQDRWIRIHVYHFTRDASRNHVVQNFGDPFFLVIEEHETLVNVKERIRKKLLIADEEFGKWQFAFVAFGHPNYLQDNDVVASRFQKRDACGAWEHYLGLEHAESAPKRTRIDIPLRSL